MKKGLVMEGGAMRGLFTAGVIDVFMENGIEFDGAIGVSAGAAFGCNIKSRQIGRPLRYNKKYCSDPRYASVGSWLKTGDLFNAEFCYRTLPFGLDPFDTETFAKNPMEFYCVATDCDTGKPLYKKLTTGQDEDVQWIRASASMPAASRPVELAGHRLLDGGMTDPIPLKKMEALGYDRIVVVATREKTYVKKKQKLLPVLAVLLRDTPAVLKALKRRHILYNRQTAYLMQKEALGEIFVIRPLKAPNIKSTEKDPEELQRVYDMGREAALERLEDLRRFLNAEA